MSGAMTSPLPIIVDSEDRGLKRPVEEVARELAPMAWVALGTGDTLAQKNRRTASLRHAEKVLDRLVQLGFLNDQYFVAKKAEEAGNEVRKPQ